MDVEVARELLLLEIVDVEDKNWCWHWQRHLRYRFLDPCHVRPVWGWIFELGWACVASLICSSKVSSPKLGSNVVGSKLGSSSVIPLSEPHKHFPLAAKFSIPGLWISPGCEVDPKVALHCSSVHGRHNVWPDCLLPRSSSAKGKLPWHA